MRHWIRILFCLSLCFASSAQAQEAKGTQPGVLCVWSIYVELKTFGEVCGFDSSSVEKLIDESLGRIEKFITDNSEITQVQLNDKKSIILSHQKEESERADKDDLRKSCAGSASNAVAVAYYKLQSTPADTVRKQISALLATPRKPVMDPCM